MGYGDNPKGEKSLARSKKQTVLFDVNDTDIPKLYTAKSRLKAEHLVKFDPMTPTQERMFKDFHSDQHVVADGCPGTGKTFVAMYKSFQEILINRKYSRIVIVRSIVPTRDIGFLPGSLEEKVSVYEQPYKDICKDLFVPTITDPYSKCQEQGIIEFMPTSFIRGTTFNDAIIIVDEAQNLEFSEASSVLTRVGRNCKLVICGDFYQSDLTKKSEKEGYNNIKEILRTMNSVDFYSFGVGDIVRSGFVKEFIRAKIKLGYQS